MKKDRSLPILAWPESARRTSEMSSNLALCYSIQFITAPALWSKSHISFWNLFRMPSFRSFQILFQIIFTIASCRRQDHLLLLTVERSKTTCFTFFFYNASTGIAIICKLMFFFLSPSLLSGLIQAFDAAGWHAKDIPLNKRKHELFWFPRAYIYIYIVATFAKIWIGR